MEVSGIENISVIFEGFLKTFRLFDSSEGPV